MIYSENRKKWKEGILMKILRNELKNELNIRTEKNFPKESIEFIDIMPLIIQKDTFKEIINKFVNSTYLFVRIVVIKNKQAYKFKSSSEYDEFYYKSYYQLLIRILVSAAIYIVAIILNHFFELEEIVDLFSKSKWANIEETSSSIELEDHM